MKKHIYSLFAALVLLWGTSSCRLGSDTDYTDYQDCSLTAFSIDDIETTYHTLDSYGDDSTYTVTVTGDDYTFTINQGTCEIFNNDSLPYGTDVTHVIASVSCDGNYGIKNNNYDADDEDNNKQWITSSTDSIDFSDPVTVRIAAYNSSYYRDYTVRLLVHQMRPDSTEWYKEEVAYPGYVLEKPRAITFGDKVAVFGKAGDALQVTVADNGGTNWSNLQVPSTLPANADYTSVTCFNDKLYMTDGTQLFSSSDALSWEAVAANSNINRLLGCNNTQLFGLNDNQFMVSTDGQTWWDEDTEYQAYIPDTNIFSAHVTLTNNVNIERTILAGQLSESTDSIAPVWYRQGDDSWAYMNTSKGNLYRLPNLKNLVVLYYKEYLIAFGGQKIGTPYPGKAFDHMYVSLDNGLTWKYQAQDEDNTYPTLPEELKGNNNAFAAYVDKDNFIWIFFQNTGDVWKGRLNRMGFEKQDTIEIDD